ncbi:hypothetical protein TWF718_010963 [Orbilia javanica]|uniref:F-box domain-containing protein n=1 Tax=Orbilia javanica TaxID=47235 RepID=A0AAN8MV48_9PEZI
MRRLIINLCIEHHLADHLFPESITKSIQERLGADERSTVDDMSNPISPAQPMGKPYILNIPPEVTYLLLDRLEKNDIAALRLTCHDMNKLTQERLFKRLVVKPRHNLTKLMKLSDEIAQHVQSIEFFPHHSGDTYWYHDEDRYQPPLYLRVPFFPKLNAVHLYGHDLQMRNAAHKLLEMHHFIKDLTIYFRQWYFTPKHWERELQRIRSLETLSIRFGWAKEESSMRLAYMPLNLETTTPIWGMINANSDSLKSLNLEFPSRPAGTGENFRVMPYHTSKTSELVPAAAGKWEKQLQLEELKLQYLEEFGKVYESTKFFDPEKLQIFSLVNCPESDAVLLELVGSMTNLKSLQVRHSISNSSTIPILLKRLPALETLHIAISADMDFDYKWLASQQRSVKNLWIEALADRSKDSDNFEAWDSLEELAIMKSHLANGRRSGIMCLKNLRIPANLRMIRLLHPTGNPTRDFDQTQAIKIIEALGIRQFRTMSAKYPRTPSGKMKRMYIKPNLKILAVGSRFECRHTHDRTRVLKLNYQHTERLGKFKGDFQRIPTAEFAREYPDTTLLSYGEERGSRAWLGKPFTTEMCFRDDVI